ncbi:AlpA family transcriptional regulator [Thioalkalivibrio sp. AKL19]|uniref:helix-turn-helix transcriptional regulator n=1 Tax=Thioalkalivibrio sp. AKL19 TaxID=1266914 RepID=UPI0005B3BE4C|nr:AlpA family transcriptional regulator [Thioalkalivibrio sp. AKL19]
MTNQTQADRLIRFPDVRKMSGFSRSTIYRREKEGRFPKRVQLGGGAVAWRESEVTQWMADPERYTREGRANA